MEEINQRWFIAQCITGKELKIKDSLNAKVEAEEMKDRISEIYVPTLAYKTKTGLEREKSQFPGYIFVRFDQSSDEAWFLIRNTDGVNGIVGSSGRRTKPTPIADEYIQGLKDNTNIKKTPDAEIKINFVIDETIEIISGPYVGQFGKVSSIDESIGRVTVNVETMGRITPITIDIKDVKTL